MKKKIIISLVVFAAVYLISGFAATIFFLNPSFVRVERIGSDIFSFYLVYDDVKDGLPRREVSFTSGENNLIGAVYGTENEKGLLVIVHGFGGDMDSYLLHVQFFVEQGWQVFTYSGTGVAPSEGSSRVNFYQTVPDLQSALNFIANDSELSTLPIVLMGHSQGGFSVTSILNFNESANVKAVVSFAGMNRSGDMIDMGGRQIMGGFWNLVKPSIMLFNYADYFTGSRYTAIRGINNKDIPVLLIQGIEDDVVSHEREAITKFVNEITNPYAEIIILEEEWNSGHNNVKQWGEEAQNYRNEIQLLLDALREQEGTLNDNILRNWAEEIELDRVRMLTIDSALFKQVERFFSDALQN